jgi:hypothetical protein
MWTLLSMGDFSVLFLGLTGGLTASKIGLCFIAVISNEVVVTNYPVSYIPLAEIFHCCIRKPLHPARITEILVSFLLVHRSHLQ